MRYIKILAALIFIGFGAFFIFFQERTLQVDLPEIPEAVKPTSSLAIVKKISDIEPQKPLANPPKEIKAVYLTSWSAGSSKKIDYLLKLAKETEINAVVIDIKDYSGYIAYDIKLPEAKEYQAKEIRIPRINSLIKKLHDEGIYMIARITVFQDPILAKARPELAIHSKSKLALKPNTQNLTPETLWLDHKKLAWIDPASQEAWDYNIAIAKDAASRGFDELNFDYIRFASDGDLNDMIFPHSSLRSLRGSTQIETQINADKRTIIRDFFNYLREKTKGVKISADLFGLATIEQNDLGIGQIIEDAYTYFDYVSPMVYPSHYSNGFLGYKNPAQYPYEVVRYSMESAINRLITYSASTSTESLNSKLRPWLQDFDLGAKYDAAMVQKQIQAIYDVASSTPPHQNFGSGGTPELINGWMLWDPNNIY